MGKIFCFGSDVDTDQIIASQYLLYPSVEEMAPHCFESLDENFATAVQAGDFVVARDNFRFAALRESTAPAVIKGARCAGCLCEQLCAHLLPKCD